MFRRDVALCLRHRPKDVKTGVSSNRYLEEPWFSKCKEVFATPPFPYKPVIHNWRFFIKPGKAASGPPLAQNFTTVGLKTIDFCKKFNDRTKPLFKDDADLIVRVQVYSDKTYQWRIEPPPIAWFLLRAARKKVKESAPADQYGNWCTYLTYEMIYEIAKIKQNWDDIENPPLEERARHIANEAVRMGIAVIGMSTPHSSPVKGMTAAQYEQQSAVYRKEQWKLYEEFEQECLKKADLIEKMHRPNMNKLTAEQLEEGLKDPKLFDSLWRVTHPSSRYNKSNGYRRQLAMGVLQDANWISKETSPEEATALFLNWRSPGVQRQRELQGVHPEEGEAFWARHDSKSEAVPATE